MHENVKFFFKPWRTRAAVFVTFLSASRWNDRPIATFADWQCLFVFR